MKWVKRLLNTEMKEELMTSSVLIKSADASLEDVFEHVYNTEKFYKWFNFYPIVWLTFDKKQLEVGCEGTIRFTLPPFKYTVEVTEVIPNERIEFLGTKGLLRGKISFVFSENEEGYVFEEPHYLVGKNSLVHKYFTMLLAPNHVPFMRWRYKVLKKNLAKDLSKRKERKIS